tara:strand:+ start:592 stop:840 length:249 start_codon:yes stop_codon:yes gene_type:complete
MISLLGNLLILLFLIPILLLVIAFLGLNAFKAKLSTCENCGATIMGDSDNCLYCGGNLNKNLTDLSIDASQETIEVEAEEIN